MDLLAEIQNRKRKLEEIGAVKDKKYVKKGDLEKERVKQYYEEQRKLEEKKNKKKVRRWLIHLASAIFR